MEDFIVIVFLIWAAIMAIGIIIALLPVFLFLAGFFLTIGFFVFIASVFSHGFH